MASSNIVLEPSTPSRPGARGVFRRSVIAAGILGPWLLLITSRQVPLFSGDGGGPPGGELLPLSLIVAVIAAAVIVRLVRPSGVIHAICLPIVVCGIALLAASLGAPFANATADYCGDFCRTAIMGRFIVFFGWPIAAGIGLAIAWQADRRSSSPIAIDRSAWSLAWLLPTVAMGLLASAAWWRIVLP